MNILRSLVCSALVLSSVPSLAWADEPSFATWVQRRVDDGIVKPLAKQEGHSFSRMRPPPRERRVRAVQTTLTTDKNGRSFVTFAVDVRFGNAEWRKDDIVGCVYPASGQLFVKRGDAYRPAEFLFGKNFEPVAGVCEAAPAPAPRA